MIKEYLRALLCIDENRVSVIALSFFILLCISIYLLLTLGDIPENATELLIWFGAFIAGYNGLQGVRNINKG